MVAESPIRHAEPKSSTPPTPIEQAKEKKKDELPITFSIPGDKQFDTEKVEYLGAIDVRYIARKVIEETSPDLSHVKLDDVDFAWKWKGGKENGQPKLFGVRLQDDVAKFHGAKTWFVWFAADNCTPLVSSPVATRAAVYAALKRIGFADNALSGETVPRIQKPELVMFYDEYRRYGAWRRELTVAENMFQQQKMPGL